jgi:hypothetical protein
MISPSYGVVPGARQDTGGIGTAETTVKLPGHIDTVSAPMKGDDT